MRSLRSLDGDGDGDGGDRVDENIDGVGDGDAELSSVDVGLKLLPLLLLLTYLKVVVFGVAVDTIYKWKVLKDLLIQLYL